MRSFFGFALVSLPLVSAITFSTPTNLTSGGPATISWSSSSGDPQVFTIELNNPNLFHNAIAIANNIQATAGHVDVTLPVVPPDWPSRSITSAKFSGLARFSLSAQRRM
ncbi:hypothetical protein BC834DRAFT_444132 [Gloeopeniophorella convolvens]|nr:hypothetical protein BC834DRAFT_444132 [Gloeopeniophorella convolvens]